MAKIESHFFKHDVTAKDDQKILELRADYGAEGYGIYWMMVETMYTSGGFIDRVAIGGLSLGYGVPKDTLLAIMESCINLGLLIEVEDGKLTSKRVQDAIGDRKQASINGKKGAEKRWKNRVDDGVAIGGLSKTDGGAIEVPCLPHATPNGKERRGEEIKEEKSAFNFNDFWIAYGKKVEKKQAKSQWSKMSEQAKEKALEVVAHYVSSTPDIKYRKTAWRWLRDEKYNDELDTEENPQDFFSDGELPKDQMYKLFPDGDADE